MTIYFKNKYLVPPLVQLARRLNTTHKQFSVVIVTQ